ncbi:MULTISPECIES: OmpP1/FadL family transporter [unclassified Duganella]|uniref:OmpP1/FadL family transporter n=1 Tax=unclassified Duganella TaxID=2636909 RepID=UPI0008811B6D|nr:MULTISPECIES: OmpP1/FadL family transporter [unclassified Duganella]SDH44935.1 long-chain fatty acid transport protein [Duganella sp. OV458]SDK57569.1 long-chain fatty acid transport protein [Duganella sp. OV510]
MQPKYLSLIIAAALSAASFGAQASGYRFGSQSVAGQGTADANGAEAADPSTIFYNPAGLSRLEGTQISTGATVVVPHSTYNDTGSTRFTGTPTGGTQADGYAPDAVAAPALYISKKLDDKWTAGLGLYVPYGAKLDYGNTWNGRYALSNIKLEAITLNPSVAWKLNEHHAFGFGIDAEFMKAELGQAVDVPGSVAALSSGAGAAQGAALIRQIAALGGNPALLRTATDGHGSNDGKDWGWGFNLGYMFTLDENTRFGLAYRSSISHKLRGSTVWDFSQVTSDPIVNKVLQTASRKENSAALVALRTPETLSANVFHQFNSKWAGMADVTFTRNNRMGNLDIEFPGTTEGAEVIRQQWKNTVRVSLGGNYAYSENLTLRGGIAYDESPVQSAELTHPALPDSDRMQYSIGANWKLSPRSSIDLAYSFLDFKDAHINYTNQCNPLAAACTGNGETTRGVYQTHLSLIGLSYNYKF